MKKPNTLYCLLLTLFALVSCRDGKDAKAKAISAQTYKEISISDEFRISIPEAMVPTTGLNNEASLQFHNVELELYLIVIEESKMELESVWGNTISENKDFPMILQYGRMQLERLGESINIKNRVGPKNLTVNELAASRLEISGSVPNVDEDLFYLLTFIEGDEKVYTVMSWTLDTNKEAYHTIFLQISNSLARIN